MYDILFFFFLCHFSSFSTFCFLGTLFPPQTFLFPHAPSYPIPHFPKFSLFPFYSTLHPLFLSSCFLLFCSSFLCFFSLFRFHFLFPFLFIFFVPCVPFSSLSINQSIIFISGNKAHNKKKNLLFLFPMYPFSTHLLFFHLLLFLFLHYFSNF